MAELIECKPKVESQETRQWLESEGIPGTIIIRGAVTNCGHYAEEYCSIAENRCNLVQRLSKPTK